MYMLTGRLHFSSRKRERISLKIRFVRYDLYSRGCSIRHPSIPFENCLKRLTYRRGVRRAEKTQIHRID